jgi:hypothetical protein
VRRDTPGGRPFVARPRHEPRLGLFRGRTLPALGVLAELREIAALARRLRPQEEAAPLDLDAVDLVGELAQPDRCDQAPGSEVVAVDDQARHDSTVLRSGVAVQGVRAVTVGSFRHPPTLPVASRRFVTSESARRGTGGTSPTIFEL